MKPTRVILLFALLGTGMLDFCLGSPANKSSEDLKLTAYNNNVVCIVAANRSTRESLPEDQELPTFQVRPDMALQVTMVVATPLDGPPLHNGISHLLNNKARHYFRASLSLSQFKRLFRVVISPNAP